MRVIVCCENSHGMMFNNRRVSQDIAVTKKITELTKHSKLWMNKYSYSLFETVGESNINLAENTLNEVSSGEYCFVENQELIPFEKWISEVVVFKWNREYPSDKFLDIDLSKWRLKNVEEFKGNSHDKVTMEVYVR